MITINPVKITSAQRITFGNEKNKNDNSNSRVGLMTLDKNSNNRINFEKDLDMTRNADSVQSNPFKAIGYSIVKAYNILTTPKKESRTQNGLDYIHLPYMA